ncbi:DUF1270 family protein [Candidatus Woesearchaeota archaeon]|nr:DUF1270 family protein [Candidatus Woesearchaeota archaeon]
MSARTSCFRVALLCIFTYFSILIVPFSYFTTNWSCQCFTIKISCSAIHRTS